MGTLQNLFQASILSPAKAAKEETDDEKDIVPYEFQDALETARNFRTEDSEYGLSEGECSEMNALAEQMEEYYYAVRVFPGQDPNQVMPFDLVLHLMCQWCQI